MENILLPLFLLKASGGMVKGRTRLQKLTFLYQEMDPKSSNPFHFFAWDYGPYSKDLQEYIDALVHMGWVAEVPVKLDAQRTVYEYRITQEGNQVLEAGLGNEESRQEYQVIQRLVGPWKKRPLDDLIRHVYSKHPEYTVRSKLLQS